MDFKVKNKLTGLKKTNTILWMMVLKSLKTQYRNSVLGILWTVLNPLLNMFVMTFVFSSIFKRQMTIDYSAYYLSGALIFTLMRGSTSSALSSIVDNRGLINKVRMPIYVIPIAKNFTGLVNLGFSFCALVVVILVRLKTFYITSLMIPVFLPSIMLFSIGLSLVLGSLYVYFRDLEHIYGVVCTLWMYCTPLFYTITALDSQKVQDIIKLNPMYHYVEYFRSIVAYGVIPSGQELLLCYGMGFAALAVGLLAYRLLKKNFVLYI